MKKILFFLFMCFFSIIQAQQSACLISGIEIMETSEPCTSNSGQLVGRIAIACQNIPAQGMFILDGDCYYGVAASEITADPYIIDNVLLDVSGPMVTLNARFTEDPSCAFTRSLYQSEVPAASTGAPCTPVVDNDPDINDPCACNLNGMGLADGSFQETVTVFGSAPGETWEVTAIGPARVGGMQPTGIMMGDNLTQVGGTNEYNITFNHFDLDGYAITVTRTSDGFPLSISNLCAIPVISGFNPAIQANYPGNNAAVTLGVNLMNEGTGTTTFNLDGTNNITQLTFDPTTSDLTTGQVAPMAGSYTLTARYETDATGSGTGGTEANPAVPTNACPVETTAMFMVGAPVPTLGQWGLITLALLLLITGMVLMTAPQVSTAQGSVVTAPRGWRNLPFDGGLFYKILPCIALLLVGGFTIAATFFGYEWTSADPYGIIVTIPLLSYMVMLVGKAEQEK